MMGIPYSKRESRSESPLPDDEVIDFRILLIVSNFTNVQGFVIIHLRFKRSRRIVLLSRELLRPYCWYILSNFMIIWGYHVGAKLSGNTAHTSEEEIGSKMILSRDQSGMKDQEYFTSSSWQHLYRISDASPYHPLRSGSFFPVHRWKRMFPMLWYSRCGERDEFKNDSWYRGVSVVQYNRPRWLRSSMISSFLRAVNCLISYLHVPSIFSDVFMRKFLKKFKKKSKIIIFEK